MEPFSATLSSVLYLNEERDGSSMTTSGVGCD